MSLEDHRVTVAWSIVVLIVCVALFPGGRRRDAFLKMLLGGAIGAVVYPLALCLFMGFAGASSVPPEQYWRRFRFTFSIYAQSALLEAIPRGAGIGVLIVAWRRVRRSRKLSQDRLNASESV